MQHFRKISDAKAGQTRVFGVRELFEERWIPANESECWDGEAKEFLPFRDGFGGEVTSGCALNGVFEETSRLEICLGVNNVVKRSVLDPFETDLD